MYVNMLNDFIFQALKRRLPSDMCYGLPSDVTFLTVLRHKCGAFSVRYNLY